MISGVYKIRNIVNDKFYLGSSKEIENRWEGHKQWLRGGYHNNPKLQHAWNKYGESNFVFEIVEEIPLKSLLNREQHYLDLWESYKRGKGYNICPTANGGDNITHNPNKAAFIKKMREINTGKGNGMFGKKHTENSIRKQKEKSIGRYTLDWFIERCGKRKGKKKFEERRQMLTNRKINYNNGKVKALNFKGRKHNKDFRIKYNHTKTYFKHHWNDFVELINSRKYSQRQLSIMLDIPRITLRVKMREILGQQKTPSEDGVVIS